MDKNRTDSYKYLNSFIPVRRKWYRQLVKLELPASQLYIMFCIFDKTYGYADETKPIKNGRAERKTEAFITYQELREYTMIEKQKNFKRELGHLINRNIIKVLKNEHHGCIFSPNTNFEEHVLKNEYLKSTQKRGIKVLNFEPKVLKNEAKSTQERVLLDNKHKTENININEHKEKVCEILKNRLEQVDYKAPINFGAWEFYIETALNDYGFELIEKAINWWNPAEKYKNVRWIKGRNLSFDTLLDSYQVQIKSNNSPGHELYRVNSQERKGGEF